MSVPPRIAVIGLGYVGLPLAVALAKHFPVIGFDIKTARIAELSAGVDRTREVEPAKLKSTTLQLTGDAARLAGHDVYIITVPTPIDAHNKPDLGAVDSASRTVGRALKGRRGAIVVLESTVYPGVTEEIVGPAVAEESGLVSGRDFFLGYSPERINPGDRTHSVDRITKVVAGQTPEIARRLADIYGKITDGGAFVARDIRTAEAAKVIENAQRDINIAFINEVTMIFNKLGLSVFDVLEASRTKWNFLPFTPGMVGGHCIGVDPYYLADLAQRLGHDPEIILAGRRINDHMAAYFAAEISRALPAGARVLVLGLAFKENVPDLRNSKVADMVAALRGHGHTVDVHDPLVDPAEAQAEYGIALLPSLETARGYDAVVCAVAHDAYRALDGEQLAALVRPDGLAADIKGAWRGRELPAGIRSWHL
jgi:UDP-N-acetyl-D-glucosamine/UDP-N-acetyl-D-galactosamine dehydrogenase